MTISNETDNKRAFRLTPLGVKIAAHIRAHGPISLHDYMQACLYDREYGYYTCGAPIGQSGDFITAPEISQIFGEIIGLWAGEVWLRMGKPPVRLIELGPGRGTLMADALRALRVLPDFFKFAAIDFVETSQPMRRAQQLALSASPCPVLWHDRLEQVPKGFAIIIANEFLDCLPVQQFAFDAGLGAWRERCVDYIDERFVEVSGSPKNPPFDTDLLPHDGSILEHHPGTGDLVEVLACRAENDPLAALFIDYGYERPSLGETLQAVRAHRFVSVFESPGESDLTAHVNFAQVAEEGKSAGLSAYGPMPMGEWLLRLGLEARVKQLLRSASEKEASAIKSGVHRLVDPTQMGVLFKVIELTHGLSAPPPPFG